MQYLNNLNFSVKHKKPFSKRYILKKGGGRLIIRVILYSGQYVISSAGVDANIFIFIVIVLGVNGA